MTNISFNQFLLYASILGFFGSMVVIFYKKSEEILEKFRFLSIGTRDYLVERLNMMFYEVTPSQIMSYLISGTVVIFIICFTVALPNWKAGFILSAVFIYAFWKMPRFFIDWIYKRRVDKFTLQMVDGLALMSNGMKSGLSIIQAISMVTEEMPHPIKQELNLVLNENRLGVSVEDAFRNLAKRIESDDVEMFVTSITILKETGGNLAETFDTISNTIRERVKLEKKIAALTAMGFSQGVVLLLIPIVMGAYNFFQDPTLFQRVLSSPIGLMAMAVVVGLEVGAYILIMKIVKIQV